MQHRGGVGIAEDLDEAIRHRQPGVVQHRVGQLVEHRVPGDFPVQGAADPDDPFLGVPAAPVVVIQPDGSEHSDRASQPLDGLGERGPPGHRLTLGLATSRPKSAPSR